MRDGQDITGQPEIWTANKRARREQSLTWAAVVAAEMEQRFDTAAAVLHRLGVT